MVLTKGADRSLAVASGSAVRRKGSSDERTTVKLSLCAAVYLEQLKERLQGGRGTHGQL